MRRHLIQSAAGTMQPAAPVVQPAAPKPPMKAVIFSPVFRDFAPPYPVALVAACTQLARQYEIGLQQLVGIPVALARNLATNSFYSDSAADVLVHIDADMGFSPNDVAGLLAGIAAGLDVVGAPYVNRSLNWEVVRQAALAGRPAHELLAAGQVEWNHQFFPEDVSTEGYVGPARAIGGVKFVRARRVGTGLFALSRRALDRIVGKFGDKLDHQRPIARGRIAPPAGFERAQPLDQRYRDFFRMGRQETSPGVFEEMGEDYAFCDSLRAAGGEVWMLGGPHNVEHVGQFDFGRPFDLHEDARRAALKKENTP